MPYSSCRESNSAPVNYLEYYKNGARALGDVFSSNVHRAYNYVSGERVYELNSSNNNNVVNSVSEMTNVSFMERIALFFLCFFMGVVFLLISLWLAPMILLVPAKFVFFFTFGNIFCLSSVGFLVGWKYFIMHLFDSSRRFASLLIVLSVVFTFLSLFKWKFKILALFSCITQFMSVLWFVLSYIPYARKVFWLASTYIGTSLSWFHNGFSRFNNVFRG